MIGVIGAMDVEVEAILEYMSNVEKIEINKVTFFKGSIHDKEICLTKSGVGKVNAAIATITLLNHFDIEYVINIGTAGGMVETQEPMDVVISRDVIQYDFDTSYIDGDSGIGLKFSSDYELAKRVNIAYNKLNIESEIFFGDIITGDTFIGEDEKVIELKNKYPNAIACEMEGGAIAQVCDKLEIPFIIIRSLSDIVMRDSSDIDFMKNVKLTSQRSANMINLFLNSDI